jgi:hypothetical protein
MDSLTITTATTPVIYKDYTPSFDAHTLTIDTALVRPHAPQYSRPDHQDYMALTFSVFILVAMLSAFTNQSWLLPVAIIVMILLIVITLGSNNQVNGDQSIDHCA